MSDSEYDRMKQAIRAGRKLGLSPATSVARMRPACENAGTLLIRWLDEQREDRG